MTRLAVRVNREWMISMPLLLPLLSSSSSSIYNLIIYGMHWLSICYIQDWGHVTDVLWGKQVTLNIHKQANTRSVSHATYYDSHETKHTTWFSFIILHFRQTFQPFNICISLLTTTPSGHIVSKSGISKKRINFTLVTIGWFSLLSKYQPISYVCLASSVKCICGHICSFSICTHVCKYTWHWIHIRSVCV